MSFRRLFRRPGAIAFFIAAILSRPVPTMADDVRAPELSVYPPLPGGQYHSDVYDVTVSQAAKAQTSYVYKSELDADNPYNKHHTFTTNANHWTSFSFSGEVFVRIRLRNGSAITKATVRPASRQIAATVADNQISFSLTKPANIFVEVDGKPHDPLFIFANPPEFDAPTASTPGTIYFGSGMTDLGATPLDIADGQTVYLAGGAYVKGRLQAADSKGRQGINVRGRGVLSGIGITENRGNFAQFMIDASWPKHSANANVEGIVVTDSPGPCVFSSKKLTAENVKMLSWSRCSDGIGGGRGSFVKNCFLKVNDDNIHFHVTGMRAIDNVVWLQAAGSALQMGWNVAQSVDGELADGLDIIGDDLGRSKTIRESTNHNAVALMDIHNHAAYRNVVVQNVRYDVKPYQIFGVRTMLEVGPTSSLASYKEGRGSVDGMVFRNFTADQIPLQLSVFDGNGTEPGSIQNVTLENVRIAGKAITEANASSYVIQRGKTSGFYYLENASPAKNAAAK